MQAATQEPPAPPLSHWGSVQRGGRTDLVHQTFTQLNSLSVTVPNVPVSRWSSLQEQAASASEDGAAPDCALRGRRGAADPLKQSGTQRDIVPRCVNTAMSPKAVPPPALSRAGSEAQCGWSEQSERRERGVPTEPEDPDRRAKYPQSARTDTIVSAQYPRNSEY